MRFRFWRRAEDEGDEEHQAPPHVEPDPTDITDIVRDRSVPQVAPKPDFVEFFSPEEPEKPKETSESEEAEEPEEAEDPEESAKADESPALAAQPAHPIDPPPVPATTQATPEPQSKPKPEPQPHPQPKTPPVSQPEAQEQIPRQRVKSPQPGVRTPTYLVESTPEYETKASSGQSVSPNQKDTKPVSSPLEQSIANMLDIDGAIGAAIVDIASGMELGSGGNPGFDLTVAAAGNSNVIRAKLSTMADLGLGGERNVEDIMITLDTQYHLIKVLNSSTTEGLFLYLVLDRAKANLALARHKLKLVAESVNV